MAAMAVSRLRLAPPSLRQRMRLARLVVIVLVVVVLVIRVVGLFGEEDAPVGVAGVPSRVEQGAPDVDRSVDVHAGYGAWVDMYDYLPPEGSAAGEATVTPDEVDDMARQGVRTLYLQAAQLDVDVTAAADRAQPLTDPDLIAQFLVRAHLAGMRVVGWYLPRFTDLDRDLAHLVAISDFEVLGHRFDGVAVDIEWTAGISDPAERSDAAVELSDRLRDAVGEDDVLAAIVLPPVQLEVVNPQKWPNFPWRELDDVYGVWLPMSYWTERTPESGYQDGWTYTTESVRRLRANLQDPDAVVHPIGGIGDRVTPAQAERFVQAVSETDAIGGSIYDWATLDPVLSGDIAARIDPGEG
jgi:hypothetical protein